MGINLQGYKCLWYRRMDAQIVGTGYMGIHGCRDTRDTNVYDAGYRAIILQGYRGSGYRIQEYYITWVQGFRVEDTEL